MLRLVLQLLMGAPVYLFYIDQGLWTKAGISVRGIIGREECMNYTGFFGLDGWVESFRMIRIS